MSPPREGSLDSRLTRSGRALGWALLGCLATVVGLYVQGERSKPPSDPWHQPLEGELRAALVPDLVATFADYRALEEELFEALDDRVAEWSPGQPTYSRFRLRGPLSPGAGGGTNWNRTWELQPEGPARGCALLLHGLSDGPYSLRAVGESLRSLGFEVLGLRLPGHGTVPGALTRVTWRDWRAATRLGVEEARRRAGEGDLLVIGYSNGAALALDAALDGLEDPSLPAIDRLVFVSPAFAVSPLVGAARIQRWMSALPGLSALAWEARLPEYDPYKFNSFPLFAGEQIFALTRQLEKRLVRLEASGRLGELPPMLVFQSVADATIPTEASVSRVTSRMAGPGHEVVLFDLNRASALTMFLDPSAGALAARLQSEPTSYDLTLVTNIDPETWQVQARRRAPAGSTRVEPLDLAWPPEVYSLSHVALPISPDDPLYGATARPDGAKPLLGRIEGRGERGVLVLPQELLMRLRWNPFFPYLERRLEEFVAPLQPEPASTRPEP